MNNSGQATATLDLAKSPDADLRRQSRSLRDFAESHAAAGMHSYPGSSGTWWLQYETGALMRFPVFAVNPPSPQELKGLYWRHRTPLTTYLLEPTQTEPADSFVYLCTDRQYHLQGLEHSVQGNVKRGLREFQIRSINQDEAVRFGERAFLDTWRRHGWTKVSATSFQKYLSSPTTLCGNRFFGAWRENQLAAFAGVIEVDDWAEIRVRYSTDESLRQRPNDALLFHILSHYLVERGFRIVSAGASSIDPAADSPGLHRFKVKMGLNAVPVRRVFSFHPLLRMFVRRAGLALFSAVLKRMGRSPRLVLAECALKRSLGIRQTYPESKETAPMHGSGNESHTGSQ